MYICLSKYIYFELLQSEVVPARGFVCGGVLFYPTMGLGRAGTGSGNTISCNLGSVREGAIFPSVPPLSTMKKTFVLGVATVQQSILY